MTTAILAILLAATILKLVSVTHKHRKMERYAMGRCWQLVNVAKQEMQHTYSMGRNMGDPAHQVRICSVLQVRAVAAANLFLGTFDPRNATQVERGRLYDAAGNLTNSQRILETNLGSGMFNKEPKELVEDYTDLPKLNKEA